ncbi:LytR/AlgR family response regulator transcription factor [Flavobacterium capsici]|uniref:Response regulator n=1 Tax=Flavobacterium capsici TaxID=3075618 RepID=A0AA96F2I4_9FLAO|nr:MULTISPECIES: response regulator [unclassified Flavobacterium]WNM18665.1 response regulator [Flavobacterium sp. PMR2A8]WNM22716.1 response regulator [Flavobacterium sp. PMTSA4]
MGKVYKILIVEDEMIIAANLSLQLKNLGYEVSGIIPRGEEVLAHVEQNLPDIILMDINLNGELDGIDIVNSLQPKYKIPIIYLTANADDYTFNRAKETNPFAFISKPFKKVDLQHAIELTIKRVEEEKQFDDDVSSSDIPFVLIDSIFIRNNDKMVKVYIDDVLYIEAERNYCKIHCKEKEHLVVSTLKDLDGKLPSKNFLRIHRSFIVNISHIDEIATSHVVISKKALPITNELKKELLQHIQKV